MRQTFPMERFVCTHCGHHFEKEVAETVICPNCFWTTSVKKKQDLSPSTVSTSRQDPGQRWLWGGGALFVVLLVGVSLFAVRHLKKQDEILQKIESKNAQVIASQAPELNLSPEQREILNRHISFDLQRPLTPKESEILAPRMALSSRLPQGVATPPWDLKQFEEFLKGVQLQYRIPLEWSYRRKLIQLFRDHYPPASQAFEAKDFLRARDEWIRALAFPVYRNDLKKHRGVLLTMLHPYINDTLSKIGAMNALLTGNDLYAREEKIRAAYQNLQDLLQKQSWEEANAEVLELTKQLEGFEKTPPAVNPPPLPQEISLVDSDIREILSAQVAPVQPVLPDLTSLSQDLAAKEKVIQSRLPETMASVRKQYEEALALIQSGNWQGAREILQKIDFPEELAADAHAKIEILDKLVSPSLDSQKDSG